MVLLHYVIFFLWGWSITGFLRNDPEELARLLYTGGKPIASLTYIPRLYYVLALLIQGICLTSFALLGNSKDPLS